MLLTGGSVIARQHMLGLDEVSDLEAKLVGRGFLGEASAHAEGLLHEVVSVQCKNHSSDR